MADRIDGGAGGAAVTLLLCDDAHLAQRRAIAAGALAPLAHSLQADLDAVQRHELYFPRDKALLSREGGRCPRDGVMLDFDPFEPHAHRCPVCGEIFRGELHDRFWIYWYQLWLAERAVHAATLAAVGADESAALGERILEGYIERYLGYPNVDNVLGPTRLFFSTYLESIWLLQICLACDLMRSRAPALVDRALEHIVEPSRAIIAEYDEGGSNRQVWNDAALIASARLLGRDDEAERAVFGESGVLSQLSSGLLPDGTWYEGENYHLFAHRGLWYGVTMAERAGFALPAALRDRFQRGFAAPFATALPDFTLPSRRDSQYAISLRQWRIAEHCELGFAREEDPAVLGALQRMYEHGVPRHDTGRWRSSADVERNAPSSALTRADLNWRALLFARETLPVRPASAPSSVVLESQGIAVMRRDAGRIYVALDYGNSGGGHGHPDRLNLLLSDGATRWLDDFGTGSYVDPSLHWYRSTLAHNAPLVNGRSQKQMSGELLAWDERGEIGWTSARFTGASPGTVFTRTVVVMPTYAVDIVRWVSPKHVLIDLPLHADLALEPGGSDLESAELTGGNGREDGFAFVRETAVQTLVADSIAHFRSRAGDKALDLFARTSANAEWWYAVAPGPPGRGDHAFRIVRSADSDGEIALVWSWAGDVVQVTSGDRLVVKLTGDVTHWHGESSHGWDVRIDANGSVDHIRIGGTREVELAGRTPAREKHTGPSITIPLLNRSIFLELGARQYRRSEQDWHAAGEPRATVEIAWRRGHLELQIDVERSDLTFVPDGAVNPYDNEPADINGDGVQLYVRTSRGLSGWMFVPEASSDRVRSRMIEGWTAEHPIDATWMRTGQGYQMRILVPGDAPPLAFDVVINEMPHGRQRRRGQLVLSGAEREFVYLRGDRHDASRLVDVRLADD